MIRQRQAVQVGTLPITPFKSMREAVETVCSESGVLPGFAVAVNAEKVISARDDVAIRENLLLGTILYADGISVVKTIKKKGVDNVRIPGCELWLELMKKAAQTGKRVYLLGASEETNKLTASKLSDSFGLNNLTRRNGYFDDEQDVIADILRLKPDIVTVALGSPKQELLITKLREVHPDAFYMGVGGSYDVFVGKVKRAPKLFCDLHLEWFYRLISQPKRIFRQMNLFRYFYLHLTGKL